MMCFIDVSYQIWEVRSQKNIHNLLTNGCIVI